MRTPPVSYFIKKAAKLESGSKTPGRDKAGKITKAQVKEIAEKKMADLNCDTVEAAMRMVEGSARSMGIEVGAYHGNRQTHHQGPRRHRPARSPTRSMRR